MEVTDFSIPGPKMFKPRRFGDGRGTFCETYNKKALAEHGIEAEFVQDNHSLSVSRDTVRGLHFQLPPFAQDKLIRVVKGSIFDVALDIREGSPHYGRAVGVVLSAEEGNQFFVPKGFAHGFCTLEAETEVLYKVSDYYAPDRERGILWNDPDLGIAWPVDAESAILSERDRAFPRLRELRNSLEAGEPGAPVRPSGERARP